MTGYEIDNIRTDNYDTYYRTEDGFNECFDISWDEAVKIENIVLKENILLSQRIEKFTIQACIDDKYETIYDGTVVGYKKIGSIEAIITSKIRIHITDARVAVSLSFVGVY